MSKSDKKYLEYLENSKKVIEEIAINEYKESFDTEESIKRKIKLDAEITDYKKNKFIEEIKSGLGEEIAQSDHTVSNLQRPLGYRFLKKMKEFIKKIFRVI